LSLFSSSAWRIFFNSFSFDVVMLRILELKAKSKKQKGTLVFLLFAFS